MADSGVHKITLSIETAIAGGSISLIDGSIPVSGMAGGRAVSRAEDLLPRVDELLRSSDIDRSDIDSIAVSNGPGSFTGLRIGLATAMGLSMALAIPCTGVSLFDAIVERIEPSKTVVVPMGRSDLCFRAFEWGLPRGDYLVGNIDEFVSFVQENRIERIAYHPDIDVSQIQAMGSGIVLTNIGFNLADYIGRYAATQPGFGSLEPIYVRNPRFA